MYVCSWMWMGLGMAPSKAPPNIPKAGLVYHALTAEKGGAEGSPSPLIAPRGHTQTDLVVWIGPAEVILRPQSTQWQGMEWARDESRASTTKLS